MRGRFGLFGILFIVVLALLVGGVAYNWGLAAGQTQVVQPGTVVYPVAYGHPFGFGFGLFGILFFFLFIGLILAALRPRRWGHGGGMGRGMGPGGPGGPGGWGPGGWGGRFDAADPRHTEWLERDVPPAFRPMLELWHKRAHGEAPPATGSTDAVGQTDPSGADPRGSSTAR